MSEDVGIKIVLNPSDVADGRGRMVSERQLLGKNMESNFGEWDVVGGQCSMIEDGVRVSEISIDSAVRQFGWDQYKVTIRVPSTKNGDLNLTLFRGEDKEVEATVHLSANPEKLNNGMIFDEE